jgi:ferredoxin
VLLHSARGPHDVIFGDELRAYAHRHDGFRLHEQDTSKDGRLKPEHLDELVPDWREREAFVCGPAEMLDAFIEHYEQADLRDHLHLERFQPAAGMGEGERGEGGTITFCRSGTEATSDGDQPILVAGEEAGLELPFGCRMGICHTCVGRLCSGKIRDLRTGEVQEAEGEIVRTCIHAPEGPIEIDL